MSVRRQHRVVGVVTGGVGQAWQAGDGPVAQLVEHREPCRSGVDIHGGHHGTVTMPSQVGRYRSSRVRKGGCPQRFSGPSSEGCISTVSAAATPVPTHAAGCASPTRNAPAVAVTFVDVGSASADVCRRRRHRLIVVADPAAEHRDEVDEVGCSSDPVPQHLHVDQQLRRDTGAIR